MSDISHRAIAVELMESVFEERSKAELARAIDLGNQYAPAPMGEATLIGLAQIHALLAIEDRLDAIAAVANGGLPVKRSGEPS